MTWKLRMVPQNSSLARRTSVEACFTGPAVISLATDHRTSGFRDDCCIPQKSLAITRDFWNTNWLWWTPFRMGAHDGFSMSYFRFHFCSTSQEICTWFACHCVMLLLDSGGFYPYPSRLLHCHWDNLTIASVAVRDLEEYGKMYHMINSYWCNSNKSTTKHCTYFVKDKDNVKPLI